MKVKAITNTDIFSLPFDTSITEATKEMAARNMGSVLVEKNGEIVGIFSERDLLNRVMARELNPNKTQLEKVMTAELKTVSETDEPSKALDIFNHQRIRHLPVKSEENKIIGMIGSRDLLYSKAEIDYANKMTMLREMASGLSHEMNNPLTIVMAAINSIEMISTSPKPDFEKLQKQVHLLKKTSMRISNIVHGFNNFAQVRNNEEFEAVKIGIIIENTLNLIQEKVKSEGIVFSLPEAKYLDTSIKCQPIHLSHVIYNLVQNAFDYTKDGENLKISIVVDKKERLFIKINNSGPKIPAEIREKIFEPFFTTKEIGEGTGLGLALSLGIIKDHGGKLYLDHQSEDTSFVIELPL